MKDFFDKPPKSHDIKVGDLVTCTCHSNSIVLGCMIIHRRIIKMNMAKMVGRHVGMVEETHMDAYDKAKQV